MTPMTRDQSSGGVVPTAAVVAGPAGVGKTTLAATLAARLGAALLDLDTATAPLVEVVAGLLGSDDLDGAALAGATRAARYEVLLAVAEDCLRCGTPVVLVAPFTAERASGPAWAGLGGRLAGAGGRPTLVWAHAPREVLRERLVRRGAGRDAAKLADLDAHLSRLDLTPPVAPHVAVDTSAPLDLEGLAAALRG
ncbi:putative kinase [Pseudokineococcus lusitanus]|uniref:Putative kinase n=2 Tax=Pseudokineococcus lusitanus TaxID=763993 RepID=A0A3N1HQC9_9ACTN|nr:putative kinase [Pseudokineococcus lusitanus]